MNDIILLNLRISMWGVSRVLPDQQFEVDADKAMVRATKKILECPEYEFLLQLKRNIHRRLRTLALPGEILRAGVYPISVGMVQTVEKTLEDFSVRWGVGVLGLGKCGTYAFARSRTACARSTTKRTTRRGRGSGTASTCAGTTSA
jgi:hypothetical protein